MTTQSMFTPDPANPAAPVVAPVVAQPNVTDTSAYANLLGAIVNERGEPKYASVELALEGLRNAQQYIPDLKGQLSQKDQELVELRSRVSKIDELERVVAELTSAPPVVAAQPQPAMSEEKLAELVNRTLTQREKESLAKTNQAAVVRKLQEVHGADAEKVFNTKAAEFDMTPDEFAQMSAKNPKAVFTMLGIKEGAQKVDSFHPTTTSVNTAGIKPAQGSFIGRNPTPAMLGATSQEMQAASQRAAAMVDELHAQGISVHDLSDPKLYYKYFS